jgi:hypothetical protein
MATTIATIVPMTAQLHLMVEKSNDMTNLLIFDLNLREKPKSYVRTNAQPGFSL